MQCLRTTALKPLSRSFPISSRSLTTATFTDDENASESIDPKAARALARANRRAGDRRTRDELFYAKEVTEQGMKRWQESQEPGGKIQFMTMGREFTIPYNLTQISYMSLNHMRELRSYYRKIMYEMPQFRRMVSLE